jgi:hypothetical protein
MLYLRVYSVSGGNLLRDVAGIVPTMRRLAMAPFSQIQMHRWQVAKTRSHECERCTQECVRHEAQPRRGPML